MGSELGPHTCCLKAFKATFEALLVLEVLLDQMNCWKKFINSGQKDRLFTEEIEHFQKIHVTQKKYSDVVRTPKVIRDIVANV